MAEKYYSWSPYVYCANNPMKYIDPTGEFVLESYTDGQLQEMGLTRDDLNRFISIIKNILNIVDDKVLDAIANATGLSKETILNDLTFGNGPTISIGKTWSGGAEGKETGITFTPEMIKNLASIPSSDRENLATQVLGTGLIILHEYGHYGDQVTNNGKNSGQYNPSTGESDASFYDNHPTSDYYKGKNIESGTQAWSKTKTGHRGTDIEMMGFGVSFGLGQNGKLVKTGGSFSNLQQKVNLRNILFTLSSGKK